MHPTLRPTSRFATALLTCALLTTGLVVLGACASSGRDRVLRALFDGVPSSTEETPNADPQGSASESAELRGEERVANGSLTVGADWIPPIIPATRSLPDAQGRHRRSRRSPTGRDCSISCRSTPSGGRLDRGDRRGAPLSALLPANRTALEPPSPSVLCRARRRLPGSPLPRSRYRTQLARDQSPVYRPVLPLEPYAASRLFELSPRGPSPSARRWTAF